MFAVDMRAEAAAIGSSRPLPAAWLPAHALDELLRLCDERCGGGHDKEDDEEEIREVAAAAAALRERIAGFARAAASVDAARGQSARAAMMGAGWR